MYKKQWTGFLCLDIEKRTDKSVPKDVFYYNALKVQRPIYHNPLRPCYYILNLGGGYLNGDTYRLEISVRKNAELTLTSLGATLIYKTPTTPAYQETEILLEENSYLEYLPDPIIGYENARFRQRDTIYMKKGATLLYSDILTPGWSAQGQSFMYKLLHLTTKIFMEDKLVVFDNIKLEPEKQEMAALGYMENYTHLGTFIVISEKSTKEFINLLQTKIDKQSGDFKTGISSLTVPGFAVRIMANMTQDIQRIISTCHTLLNEKWYANTTNSLRKY
ncbi:MAG: urease accessory protein [Aequorivita sp.]|nr:urease accessory protein [Aequorivita sp.]|tara:strand:- start:25632 stop:26459 length:828 start_codon:yes stop_codon:yes gene_type:complete